MCTALDAEHWRLLDVGANCLGGLQESIYPVEAGVNPMLSLTPLILLRRCAPWEHAGQCSMTIQGFVQNSLLIPPALALVIIVFVIVDLPKQFENAQMLTSLDIFSKRGINRCLPGAMASHTRLAGILSPIKHRTHRPSRSIAKTSSHLSQ